jgi:hypothetical protein
MGFSSATAPKKCSSVICEHLPDGSTLLFDTRNLSSIAVTQSAALIWEACDGRSTVEAITADLVELYEAPAEVVAADVERLLEDFAQRGLLESSSVLP